MLKKLAEIYKTKKELKEKNKPKYSIRDLYVGKIVRCISSEYIGNWTWHCRWEIIKDNAIFKNSEGGLYFTHIKSNQTLEEDAIMEVGDYSANNVKEFTVAMMAYMYKNKLSENSKLSYNQIVQLEDDLNNNKLNLNNDEVFK